MKQKSISKAAQILSITQSAASHALQRLRSHLKDDLFVRVWQPNASNTFCRTKLPDY